MPSAWRRLRVALAAIVNWRFFKPAVFIACAVPLAWLAYDFYLLWTGRDPSALGTDPKKTLLHETGQNALTLLMLTLTVTPVRRIFGINRVQAVRRMLGVWAFTYALTHLSIYLVFDQLCYSLETCQLKAIWEDVLKRPFILVGQLGFAILLVLAITSTAGWMRRLRKNWTRLHRLVYVAAAAGVVHFLWIQKSDISEPLKWGYWLSVLLLLRLYWALARRSRMAPATVKH